MRRGKKHPHGKARSALLVAMITLLCFSATLIAADLLSGRSGIAEYAALFTNAKKGSSLMTYYAVYASSSEDMGISYKNAAVIRAEGGAGYVMKEGDIYYVVLNLYQERGDAESVAARSASYGIREISFPPFDLSKAKSLASAEGSKNLYEEAYLTLYQAANNLASDKYGAEDFRRDLLKTKEEIAATESAYAESIRGKEETVTIEYKVLLSEIRSAFDNLTQSEDHLVSDARYYSVMIVHAYALFSRKYFS